MADFMEMLKENAELSKRETTLAVLCAALLGLVVGIFIGTKFSGQNRQPKKIVIKEYEVPKEDAKVLSREDYE